MSERRKAIQINSSKSKRDRTVATDSESEIPANAQSEYEDDSLGTSDAKRLKTVSSSSTLNLGTSSQKTSDRTKILKAVVPPDSLGDASTPISKGNRPPSLVPAPEQAKRASEKTPEITKSPAPSMQPSNSAVSTEAMDTSMDETSGSTLIADSTFGVSQGKLLDEMLEKIFKDYDQQKESANMILPGLTKSAYNKENFRVSGLVLELWGLHCTPGLEGDKDMLGLPESINVKAWYKFLHQDEDKGDKLELPPAVTSPCYYIRVATAVNTLRVIKSLTFDKLETHFKEVIANGRISEYPHYSILFAYHYMLRVGSKKPTLRAIFKNLSLPDSIPFMTVFDSVVAYVNEPLTPSCSLCFERVWVQRRDRFYTLITKMIVDVSFVQPLKFLMQNFCEFAPESDVKLTLKFPGLDSKRIPIHREILRYWGLDRIEKEYKKTVADPRDQSFKYTVWLLYRDDRLKDSILMKHLKSIEECLLFLGFDHTRKILNFDVQRMEEQLKEERKGKETTVVYYYLKKPYIWIDNASVLATLSVVTMQQFVGHDNLYLPEIEVLKLSIRWAKLQPDPKASLSTVIDLMRIDRLDKKEFMNIASGDDKYLFDADKRLAIICLLSEYEHLRENDPNYSRTSKRRQPLQ